MSNRQGDKAVHMSVGDNLECYCPVITSIGEGWFPVQGKIKFTGVTGGDYERDLINGWCMDNEEVGNLIKIEDKVGVIYEHLFPQVQYLYFFAASGETGVVSIIPTPIHDHSSIIQGGPAYGTYYRDKND